MPTYDYQCDACDHCFELFQRISAPVKRKCPECGRLKLRRLFGTGAAILFKGSGFYETDYRSDSYKKSAEADRKAETTSNESSSDKKGSESKKSKAEKKTTPKPDKGASSDGSG